MIATYGFSDEARQIYEACRELDRSQRLSATCEKQALFNELLTVWEECKLPNWDGYQALPVSRDSILNAYLLLKSLPMGLPKPSIGAEPDGEITLEWHHSPWQTLSVSVSGDGYLHYSRLFGPNHENGTIAFFGDIPADFLPLIERAYAR